MELVKNTIDNLMETLSTKLEVCFRTNEHHSVEIFWSYTNNGWVYEVRDYNNEEIDGGLCIGDERAVLEMALNY